VNGRWSISYSFRIHCFSVRSRPLMRRSRKFRRRRHGTWLRTTSWCPWARFESARCAPLREQANNRTTRSDSWPAPNVGQAPFYTWRGSSGHIILTRAPLSFLPRCGGAAFQRFREVFQVLVDTTEVKISSTASHLERSCVSLSLSVCRSAKKPVRLVLGVRVHLADYLKSCRSTSATTPRGAELA
jgi:hypothetical protein